MSVEAVMDNKPKGLERKWKVLISVMFGIFMIILDSTVVNIAFQTLRREYGASLADAQWVISIYVLSLGVTTPVSGYLADRFGIKRMYLLGFGIICAWFVSVRNGADFGHVDRGACLAGIWRRHLSTSGTRTVISRLPARRAGYCVGIFWHCISVCASLGPILGGWLVDINLWRLIFFINIPIGILGVFLGSRFLVDHQVERKPSFDPLGLITAAIGFGSILYAASIAEINGWTGSTTLMFAGIGVAFLILHTFIELRVAKEPMASLRLLKISTFSMRHWWVMLPRWLCSVRNS